MSIEAAAKRDRDAKIAIGASLILTVVGIFSIIGGTLGGW